MAIDRRQILTLLLAGLAGTATARGESLRQRLFVSCRMDAAGTASVACFDAEGQEVFATSLPARGHDATIGPDGGALIVFARRPGNWFVVLDRASGRLLRAVHAPEGRHFYGHGVVSADGGILYATENDIATGAGVIGLYATRNGYARIGEFPSGGIGPHDLALLPGGERLIVANGGLRTHPETGRETLNPDDLRPNLAILDQRDGAVAGLFELGPDQRRLSIRHLALRSDGVAAFGCQYQGEDDQLVPLLGTLSADGRIALLDVPEDALARLNNYVGSVSFDDSGRLLAATSPHGGAALFWDMSRQRLADSLAIPDVCGVAPLGPQAFLLSSGNAGLATKPAQGSLQPAGGLGWVWDNHTLSLDRAV
jgi:hypothetical protein